MAKIYVSSTYLDLKEHREQVERVIRRMGHEDVAMEYYVAEDQRPVAKCLADVAACDVYVGIFAWRYGWLPKENNPDNLSITAMELHKAEKTKKPCLIFLLSDDAPWLPKNIDDDKSKIKNLRSAASANHLADYFATPDELARKVGEALHKWEKEHGYIPTAPPIPELNLTAYYSALRKRYGVLALEGLTPPQKEEYLQIQLRSVFVEQNVRENPPPVELPKEVWEKLSRDKEIHPDDLPSGITLDDVRKTREAYYEKSARPVLEVLSDTRYQHSIILGDPGSGKSTLARYAMLSLIDRGAVTLTPSLSRLGEGALPLLIELRSYAGLCAEKKCDTFLEFLEYLGKTEGWGLTQIALNNYLKNDGRAVVVFDGLDEIFDPELRERIAHQIVGFAGDYPKAHIIVTSRVIGYRRKILTDAGFTHFTLQDLDEKQVETFVSRWYDLAMSERPDEAKERRERILRSFKESASIRALAGNPMLLTIMAIIGKHQELPRERWKLYDHAASVLIQHWDVNKHLKDVRIDADFIGEDDKKELLRRLAFRMQGAKGGLAGNYIHRDQLQAEFEDYLKARYAQTPDRAAIITRAMLEQFRERNFILSLYGASVYGFVHRAFLEYFCASVFVYKFEKTKELTIEQLKTDVYGKHWEDQSWHEVLRLICGMIDETWAGEVIDYLVDDTYRPWPEWFEVLPWNISLAVAGLSELRNPNLIAPQAERLLYAVCSLFDHDIRARESSNPDDPENVIAAGDNLTDFLANSIIPNAEAIGSSWPHREELSRWLKRRKSFTEVLVPYEEILARFIVALGYGLDSVHQILLNDVSRRDWSYRIVAMRALALGWGSLQETLVFLQNFLNDGKEKTGRYGTIRILAEFWSKDQSTLALLCKLALDDGDEDMRSIALDSLAKHCREDTRTLPLLRERALRDTNEGVRSSAISSLAENFQGDESILTLLRDRAINDPHEDVRWNAVWTLARYFSNDERTFLLLCDRVVSDGSPKSDDEQEPLGRHVREVALNAIAENWQARPETLLLLHERAQNDPTPWLRDRAKELADELEGKAKKE